MHCHTQPTTISVSPKKTIQNPINATHSAIVAPRRNAIALGNNNTVVLAAWSKHLPEDACRLKGRQAERVGVTKLKHVGGPNFLYLLKHRYGAPERKGVYKMNNPYVERSRNVHGLVTQKQRLTHRTWLLPRYPNALSYVLEKQTQLRSRLVRCRHRVKSTR